MLGTCAVCKAKVYDEMIKFDKITRHADCHTCHLCKEKLGSSSFFMDKDKTICEACASKKMAALSLVRYRQTNEHVLTVMKFVAQAPAALAMAPSAQKQTSLGTCSTCAKTITGNVVSANGKTYCAGCLKVFSAGFAVSYFVLISCFCAVLEMFSCHWRTRCVFQSGAWSHL